MKRKTTGSAGAPPAVCGARAANSLRATQDSGGDTPLARRDPSSTRVLMTADTVGGVWNYSIDLMRALPQVEFALCTMGAPLAVVQKESVASLQNVSVFSSSYKLEWMDDPWHDVDAAGDWLLDIAAKFQADLIHLNGYSHAVLPWNTPVIVVAHSCVLSWWRAVQGENAPSCFDEYRERVTAGLRAADIVIAPSRSMLESLRENYDTPFNGRVIYNGCDAARLLGRVTPICHPERSEGPHNGASGTQSYLGGATADERSFAALRMTGECDAPGRLAPVPSKQQKILAAGRLWDEAKNLRTLDAIAPSIRWPIEIAGDLSVPGGETIALRHARALKKLASTQLAAAMSRAAIFVAPARYEPFGLSILEAAHSGCALVLGDILSLRELWSDCALFVDPEDHAAITRALSRFIVDETLRVDVARRALARAHEFSATTMAGQYDAAYRELPSRKSTERHSPQRRRRAPSPWGRRFAVRAFHP